MSPLPEETSTRGTTPTRRIEPSFIRRLQPSLFQEVWLSTELLFQSKLTWLLVLGPVALVGDATGLLGEAACFAFSGIALIPCAERLSFVTEQVAAHTNGTIGALLNATFGNAPELLISTAALRAGFYRVVQLAMLGSMLTNLLFVFGISCLVGGLRWQVQELRVTSGNVNVGMLLAATAGCLFPAALKLSGQLRHDSGSPDVPSQDIMGFCRVNAAVMMILYLCFLLFQLGTHKDEFDEEETIVETEQHTLLLAPHYTQRHHGGMKHRAKRNLFCLKWLSHAAGYERPSEEVEMTTPKSSMVTFNEADDKSSQEDDSSVDSNEVSLSLLPKSPASAPEHMNGQLRRANLLASGKTSLSYDDKYMGQVVDGDEEAGVPPSRRPSTEFLLSRPDKKRLSDPIINLTEDDQVSVEAQMSFRTGIVWLFIITLCISAMSDILVDTIDGFAYRMHMSEVFTSMVIVPFFSNVAEQVSAILFAYRNEMDLCVGVTVGSAIQIALFVLPGSVLIGWMVDRSMNLFFRGYETVCLFFGVLCVAAVLQGGTTNWLVGTTLIGIYVMMATGFWFHQLEDLSTDAEIAIQNHTDTERLL